MNEQAKPLTSWKQIAAYLGVTQRTAQKWEKVRGLPVTRIPGGRGMVMADRTALDAWRSGAGTAARQRSIPFKLLALALLLAALAVAATLVLWPSDSQTPANYRIEGQTVVILNQRGSELWSKAYTAVEWHWQIMPMWGSAPVRIRDIDGDGAEEVLIAHVPVGFGEGTESGLLVCYSSDGNELWRFETGGTVRTSASEFRGPFAIRSFAVSSSVPAKIAVSSTHHTEFPSQVALLSHRGELESEYWHSGWLLNLTFLDVDADGAEELYAGGVSNASDRATVVVLNPERADGTGAEPADFQLLGMATHRELLRAFFPRTCLNRRQEARNFVREIKLVEEGLSVLTVEINSSVGPDGIYHLLSREFETIRTTPQGGFEVAHLRAFESGEVTHPLSKAELSELEFVEVIRPDS